ncbi:MAG: hypothetical protein ACRD96_13590 [Bryobacteraceae bacterium]
MDFLLLVNSTHATDTLKIEDSCAHCTQRISLKIDGGRLKTATPAEPIVFQGGG